MYKQEFRVVPANGSRMLVIDSSLTPIAMIHADDLPGLLQQDPALYNYVSWVARRPAPTPEDKVVRLKITMEIIE